jgi:hypothetical protein
MAIQSPKRNPDKPIKNIGPNFDRYGKAARGRMKRRRKASRAARRLNR